MRVLLAAATILTLAPHALSFPFLQNGAMPSAEELSKLPVKRGLQAMKRDPELIELIRDLYTRQRAEAREWKRVHKRDVVGGLLNGTIGTCFPSC